MYVCKESFNIFRTTMLLIYKQQAKFHYNADIRDTKVRVARTARVSTNRLVGLPFETADGFNVLLGSDTIIALIGTPDVGSIERDVVELESVDPVVTESLAAWEAWDVPAEPVADVEVEVEVDDEDVEDDARDDVI